MAQLGSVDLGGVRQLRIVGGAGDQAVQFREAVALFGLVPQDGLPAAAGAKVGAGDAAPYAVRQGYGAVAES